MSASHRGSQGEAVVGFAAGVGALSFRSCAYDCLRLPGGILGGLPKLDALRQVQPALTHTLCLLQKLSSIMNVPILPYDQSARQGADKQAEGLPKSMSDIQQCAS